MYRTERHSKVKQTRLRNTRTLSSFTCVQGVKSNMNVNSGSQILSRELEEWEVRKMEVGFGYLTLYECVYVSH